MAGSLHGLAQRVAKGRYPSIHVKYSRNLRDLISRMLSTSPAQRPDLDQVRMGLSVFCRTKLETFHFSLISSLMSLAVAGFVRLTSHPTEVDWIQLGARSLEAGDCNNVLPRILESDVWELQAKQRMAQLRRSYRTYCLERVELALCAQSTLEYHWVSLR